MKPWYQSRTIWGAIISVGAVMLRNFGVDLDDAQQQAIATALCDLVTVIGGVVVVHGRVNAQAEIK